MGFFKNRKERKKKEEMKKRAFNIIVPKEEFKPFLQEVDKALCDLVRDFPDRGILASKLGSEFSKWIRDLPEINMSSFKCGVCYGAFLYASKKPNIMKNESYVV